MSTPQTPPRATPRPPKNHTWGNRLLTYFLWCLGFASATLIGAIFALGITLSIAYQNLPDISDLLDYRPKLPLRIFSADEILLAEFGEERRKLTPITEIPQIMKDAMVATEDARFYAHNGIDYIGVMRAILANLNRLKSQGASTITMQVAKNVYLSPEKTFARKIYELALTIKLEHLLTKDQILEIYMNQIYLGNRAYGFAAAAETYFGKPLKDITIAEAAMLAGLPKAPTSNNPISRPEKAKIRQMYVISRMESLGFITADQAETARTEPLTIKTLQTPTSVHAEFVTETVRQAVVAQYGNEAYSRGLNVYTTLDVNSQNAAYNALRAGILNYEKRQFYRGPENFTTLPSDPVELEEAIDEALAAHPDNGELWAAVVLTASPSKVVVLRPDNVQIEITGTGLRSVQSGLNERASAAIKIKPGAIVRILQTPANTWEITQLPEVEGAFVAINPQTGDVKALVGGFDFNKNKFNHVTQAWRQPGSSFKPFIYSAALEKGFTPLTVVNDAPLSFETNGRMWEPKNYDGTFEGPMTLQRGLARSKNMITIRLLQAIGVQTGQQWATHFGFDADKHPAYLPIALGAGAVTPMQMAVGYSVFANGGYLTTPRLITKIVDHKGKILSETPPGTLETPVISARNAFVMGKLLQEVARSGTAARAQSLLKRPDIYGKTGTTNEAMDTWFAGYQPTLVAVTWVGYDTPRSLGSRETGGGLSLPIWISFMEKALKDVPVVHPKAPSGLVQQDGTWLYREYANDGGITSLGMEDALATTEVNSTQPNPKTLAEERAKILDLFKK